MADLLAQLRAAVREFGGGTPINELPTGTLLPDDGYGRTEPGVIGAGKRVIVAHIDEHGIAFTDLGRKAEDDHTPDLQRQSLIKQYTQRKKDWAAFSAQQEKKRNDSSNG